MCVLCYGLNLGGVPLNAEANIWASKSRFQIFWQLFLAKRCKWLIPNTKICSSNQRVLGSASRVIPYMRGMDSRVRTHVRTCARQGTPVRAYACASRYPVCACVRACAFERAGFCVFWKKMGEWLYCNHRLSTGKLRVLGKTGLRGLLPIMRVLLSWMRVILSPMKVLLSFSRALLPRACHTYMAYTFVQALCGRARAGWFSIRYERIAEREQRFLFFVSIYTRGTQNAHVCTRAGAHAQAGGIFIFGFVVSSHRITTAYTPFYSQRPTCLVIQSYSQWPILPTFRYVLELGSEK